MLPRLSSGCCAPPRPPPRVSPLLLHPRLRPTPSSSPLRLQHSPQPQLLRASLLRVAFKPSDAQSVIDSIKGTDVANISTFDDNDLYDTSSECPHGMVIGIMRAMEKVPGQCSWPQQVLTAYPDETLMSIIPKLNQVTGLPVIDRLEGKVIGVISRKDIIKQRNSKGPMEDKVSKHMTSPAIVVSSTASVQQAADLMLSRRIRRLPVVDEQGGAVGIVSRSDIFKPLFREAYNLFMEKEKAALMDPSPSSSFSSASSSLAGAVAGSVSLPSLTWRIKYLYDGDCPMCLSLMTVLKRQDNNRGLINFINIADSQYQPRNHMGITYDEAMETIHAIYPDGSVIQGTAALKELFGTVGLGWAVQISDLPIVAKIVDVLYEFLSANRLSLGGALDGIIAAKRMDMSKKGVETCGDVDEQCTAEW